MDWTNPMFTYTTGVYTGTGTTHTEAVEKVINEWDEDNRYPDGMISYEFKVPNYGVSLSGEFDTDGKSFFDELTAWFDYVAIGSAVVAGVATLVLPVPGSRVVSAAIWASIFTSTTAATINIAQRHSEGFGNWKDDTFDGLSIVGNLFAGAAAWKIGTKITSAARIGTMTKAALIGQIGTDGLQGILLGEQYLSDYQAIMDDQTLAPSERLSKIMELLRSAAIAGALTYVSVKGTKADLDNLNAGASRIAKAEVENTATIIDLDEKVATVPVTRNQDAVETVVESEPKRQQSPEDEGGRTVPPLKLLKDNENSFKRDLEHLVKKRANVILSGQADIGKNSAIATSRSGIEKLDYKSPDFENLGGTKQFKGSKSLPGFTRNLENETFTIKSEKDLEKYMRHVQKLYKDKLKKIYGDQTEKIRLNPYMKQLIEDYLRNTPVFENLHGAPGLHAEVQAVNDVFNELSLRGIDPRTYDMGTIKVATYHTNGKYAGTPFPACKNCQSILTETDILTGKADYDSN